jgi:hypothetical protein
MRVGLLGLIQPKKVYAPALATRPSEPDHKPDDRNRPAWLETHKIPRLKKKA